MLTSHFPILVSSPPDNPDPPILRQNKPGPQSLSKERILPKPGTKSTFLVMLVKALSSNISRNLFQSCLGVYRELLVMLAAKKSKAVTYSLIYVVFMSNSVAT